MQLILRLNVVRAVSVIAKDLHVRNVKWEHREGNKEEKDTRNIFSFPYKIRLELFKVQNVSTEHFLGKLKPHLFKHVK